jgi:NAD(P)H-hydrate epimerase
MLMERAGQAVARLAKDTLERTDGRRVVLFCGKGNNGGDGFVVARYLLAEGFDVRCLLAGTRDAVIGDAHTSMARAEQAGVVIEEMGEGDLERLDAQADLIIDALLGTGVKGPARGAVLAAIQVMNQSRAPVLSIDIPSGLLAGTGPPEQRPRAGWLCVKADRTVAIGLMKRELITDPGKAWAGEIDVADIGFPDEAIAEENLWLRTSEPADIRSRIPIRPADAHKGACGKIAILAGSRGMAGAAALTALATLRAGAGLAIVGAPESLTDVLSMKLTEVMTRPLPETPEHTLSLAAESEIERLTDWADVLAIGPGLSRHPDTMELVCRVTLRATKPVVLDADGLNAFEGRIHLLGQCPSDLIITPHIGELSRLTGLSPDAILADRFQTVRRYASESGIVIVLKGAGTLVASPDGLVWINRTGNPGMATAGAGDTLTGIIAAFLGQGLSSRDAALLGVYLHGLSGDLAARRLGQHSLMAGDLINFLPDAFLHILSPPDKGETCDASPS